MRTALKLRSALAALPVLAEALRGTDTAAHRSALLAEAHTVLSHTSFAELLGSLDGVLDGDGPQAGDAAVRAETAARNSSKDRKWPLWNIWGSDLGQCYRTASQWDFVVSSANLAAAQGNSLSTPGLMPKDKIWLT